MISYRYMQEVGWLFVEELIRMRPLKLQDEAIVVPIRVDNADGTTEPNPQLTGACHLPQFIPYGRGANTGAAQLVRPALDDACVAEKGEGAHRFLVRPEGQ